MSNGEGEALQQENQAFYEKLRRYGINLKEWTKLADPPDFSVRADRW